MTVSLILVSNREPYLLKRGGQGAIQIQKVMSGLMGALDPAMSAQGGHWISWSGFEREAPKSGESLPERTTVPAGRHSCVLRRIPLTEREASLYYYGFACRTLWPLLHLQLGRVQFDAEAWRAYRRVNQRFADAVLEVAEKGDRVWIHDYHLALVPGMLRAAQPELEIGLSWHVPWAPPDVVRTLPWLREILEGMLGADQIGMALARYGRHFLASVDELCHAPVKLTGDGCGDITFSGRTSRVGVFTQGCDYAWWEQKARAARGGRAVRLRRNLNAEKLALAVDRLDQTRGVIERLRAIERFFDRFPSWRGRLVFCQIAVPSRTRVEEYRDRKREVDELVQAINARFQQASWMPVRYLYRAFDPEDLAVYYAAADIALCTPLADGVSFVPSEYLASRTREDGSLILSPLCGAADEFPEAMLVNPYDEEGVAAALHSALEMHPEETRARMRALRARARHQDLNQWLQTFWQSTFGGELALPRLHEPALAAPREAIADSVLASA